MKRIKVAIFCIFAFLLLPQLCWAAPVISSISPTNHNPGSFSLIISGSGFTTVSSVRIYNATTGTQVASPGFTINSDSQITANANLQAGSYRLRVRTSQGYSNYSSTLTVSSTTPVISTISPTSGYTGALTIVLGGSNFTNVSGVHVYNTVGGTRSSQGIAASYTLNSNSQITATAQLKAGSYSLRVTTSAGSSNNSPALTVTNPLPPLPVISGISPTTNQAGAFNVLINGTNFANIQAVKVFDAVSGSSTNATYTATSATQISASVNLAAGSFYFQVTTTAGSSNNSPTLTVTPVTSPPVISGISPTTNQAGAFNVLINGTNFANIQAVKVFDAVSGSSTNATYTATSATQISASVNLAAGSFYFQVTTTAGTSNNSPTLTVTAVTPPPAISSISPTTHQAGAFSVLINGTNFANIQAVKVFDAVSGSSTNATYTATSATQISASVNLAAGSFYFQVTTTTGTSNNSPTLTVTAVTPPPPPPPATTTYKLNSTIPGIVNVGTVSEGINTAGGRVMWRDSSGQVNLLATFGDGPWYGHYINMDTGVRKMVQGALQGCAQECAFNPAYNKLYGATGYAGYHNSFWEFDAATQTVKIISDRNLIGPIGDALIGGDNRVYLYTQGCNFYSYDPAVGMPGGWKAYGTISLPGLDIGSNYRELAVDKQYIYLGLKRTDGTWTLAITPIGTSNWQEWQFSTAGDTDLQFRQKKTTHEWYARRTLANGTTKIYWLANGTFSDSGLTTVAEEQDLTTISPFCYSADNQAMYNVFPDNYAWEVDLTELFPIKSIHEYSGIQYRKVGTQTWSGSTVPFTGPWVPQSVQCIAAHPDQSIFAATAGYNAAVKLDAVNFQPNYLGVDCFSPYQSLNLPSGEIYVGGYSNRVMRYDPTLPWTLTTANSAPRLPSDATKPNPYFIKTTGDTYHYRHGLDYDCNGLVWIGSNTTRCNPDYGNVMWYNPVDGSTGYVFPGWKAAGTMFRNLCATNSRRRICVSDNVGNIWIVDAATKTVDPTPITPIAGSKTYMIEVQDDVVFGIVLSDSGNKVIRFKPSTKQILTLQDLGVSGVPFGFGDSQYSRMNYKLEKGPDGYVWMFMDDSLYRVDPTTCVFTKIKDATCAQLKFDSNNVNLLLYCISGTSDFRYIPGLLQAVTP